MEQELKQQAYRVLINKIEVESFEKDLYKLVEKRELKYNSILFDFVSINYRSKNYKKELMNLIKAFCSEEELLSLKIYEKCLKIIKSNDSKEIYNFIEWLSSQYLDDEYNIFYNFYRIDDEINLLEIGYGSMNNEQIIKNTKEYSELVIDKFNFYKQEEDWIGFLTDSSYNDFDYSKNQKSKENFNTSKGVLKKEQNGKFYSFILSFFGLQ